MDKKSLHRTIIYESVEKLETSWIEDNSISHDFSDGKGIILLKGSVTQIGDMAFADCTVTSIIIPPVVTRIGEAAFRWCQDLVYVSIPDSVTEICDEAFLYCSFLKFVSSNITSNYF